MMKEEVAKNGAPRLSVLIMGYNQEAFIGETIDAALNQHYEGELEVVLCDDCSTDGTFAVMQQRAADYRGPFRVVVHRCPVNGKVAVNMNVAVKLASGDWLVRVDGDDVMHPDRCRLMAEAIRRFPGAMAVSGQFRVFRSGDPLPEVRNPEPDELVFEKVSLENFGEGRPKPHLEWWGCAMMLSRKVFDVFGDLPAECAVLDDSMFATRSLMLGEFVTIRNAVLLYYRRHEGNMSSQKVEERSLRAYRRAELDKVAYYKKGLVCHASILEEMEAYVQRYAGVRELQALYGYFVDHFQELRRQALWWDMGVRGRWAWIWSRQGISMKGRLIWCLWSLSPGWAAAGMKWKDRKERR